MGINYWRGSSVEKGQPQLVDSYLHQAKTTFKLLSVPDFASGRFKLMEHLDPSSRVSFVVGLQKSLLKNLAYFSQIQADAKGGDIRCSYSLRIIYDPKNFKSNGYTTEIYITSRIAGNDRELVSTLNARFPAYMMSSLRSQLYLFEQSSSDNALPNWLQNSEYVTCHEILRQEEVFPWLEQEVQNRTNFGT
jgi:hypothetical protein